MGEQALMLIFLIAFFVMSLWSAWLGDSAVKRERETAEDRAVLRAALCEIMDENTALRLELGMREKWRQRGTDD